MSRRGGAILPDATALVRIATPIGTLEIEGDEGGVTLVEFVAEKPVPRRGKPLEAGDPALPAPVAGAVRQLGEYFAGTRTRFGVALAPAGTPFQRRVWDALLEVGFGETSTYGAIARAIGRPRSVRAVGAANGANPVSIIVPCHRIVGASGALTGYGGGLWRKEWLLAHERRHSKAALPFP